MQGMRSSLLAYRTMLIVEGWRSIHLTVLPNIFYVPMPTGLWPRLRLRTWYQVRNLFLPGLNIGVKATPLPLKDIKLIILDGDFVFYSDTRNAPEILDKGKVLKIIHDLGCLGAYTHEIGRYWVYRTLDSQPAVLRALAARYPQILVDESQDLGTLHKEILKLLITAGVQVTLIGDVNQGFMASLVLTVNS